MSLGDSCEEQSEKTAQGTASDTGEIADADGDRASPAVQIRKRGAYPANGNPADLGGILQCQYRLYPVPNR